VAVFHLAPGAIATNETEDAVMSLSIIDTIQQVFSTDVVNQVASSTGETTPKARSALSAGAFAATAGLIDRGGTREGAEGLLAGLKRAATGPGEGMGIFGDKDRAGELVNAVASSSGTSQATAQRVLGSIAPVAAGILGKHVLSKGLDADGLSLMLMGEKQGLLGNPNLPSPLRGMLERGDANAGLVEERAAALRSDVLRPDVLRPDVSATNLPETAIEVPHKRTPWALIAALGIAAIAIIGALATRGRHEKVSEVLPHVETPVANAPEIPKPDVPTPELSKPEAPKPPEAVGTTNLTGGQVAQTPSAEPTPAGAPAPEESYVVNFAFATTQLTPGGDTTLDRLTALMKANPDARIRLDGYADSAGASAANVSLARQRADAVKAMIVAKGIDASRIETAAHGEKDPVAPNDTNQDRQRNRRVEATVLSR
jgi:outer membrane protein OmpA-like peptidoglycan-associated protein